MEQKSSMLYYKGRPLVRSGNAIYYGDVSSAYIVALQIIASKETEGVNLPSKVSIHMMSTDETVPLSQRIAKKAERTSLYEALALACVWLERKERESTAASPS